MANVWFKIWNVLPANQEIVWIRVLNYYGEPFLAKFSTGPEKFTSVTTSIDIPVYYIARWRPQ